MSAVPYSVNELATVLVASEIRDDDLVFVGVGTNGRAFTLAVESHWWRSNLHE